MKNLATHVAELREASRHLIRRLGLFRETSSQCGCTLAQCHALLELEINGQLTVCGLADLLRQDKSTASRALRPLISQALVKVGTDPSDKRCKLLKLTPSGRKRVMQLNAMANAQVQMALELLDERERETVVEGVRLYAKALERSSKLEDIEIRPMAKRENQPLENLLRRVMREFGAIAPGGPSKDDELNDMYGAYSGKRSAFFVAAREETLLGGAGIAPLKGGREKTCELRKMYLVPEARGIGLGRKLLEKCLKTARAKGFQRCYLETLQHMSHARHLYAKFGFRPLEAPLVNTEHSRCDSWAIKELDQISDTQCEH